MWLFWNIKYEMQEPKPKISAMVVVGSAIQRKGWPKTEKPMKTRWNKHILQFCVLQEKYCLRFYNCSLSSLNPYAICAYSFSPFSVLFYFIIFFLCGVDYFQEQQKWYVHLDDWKRKEKRKKTHTAKVSVSKCENRKKRKKTE